MENDSNDKARGSLSRRDFAKRSIIILAGAGTAGLVGYGLFNTKKIRTIYNRQRMGHCAPTVMQTLLGINGIENDDMVKYAAGLAGGIAGSEMECGVLTAPLMFMGYSNSNLTGINEKLNIIRQAQSYIQEFNKFNGTTICKNIQQSESCRHAIINFYKPYSQAIKSPVSLSVETKEAYTLLLELSLIHI